MKVFHTLRSVAAAKLDQQNWITMGIDKSGIDHHHPIGVSPDGLWSVEGVECLANCGFGPNMMVNDLLYEKVTPEVLEEVIAKYQTA